MFLSKIDKLSKTSYHPMLASGSSSSNTSSPAIGLNRFCDFEETHTFMESEFEDFIQNRSLTPDILSQGDKGNSASEEKDAPGGKTKKNPEDERLKLQGFGMHFKDFRYEGFVWKEEKLLRAFQQAIKHHSTNPVSFFFFFDK